MIHNFLIKNKILHLKFKNRSQNQKLKIKILNITVVHPHFTYAARKKNLKKKIDT